MIISKNNVLIGKGYVCDGLFKLSVICNDQFINKSYSQVFLIDSFDVWHGRLGHIGIESIKRLMDCDLIPKSRINTNKCEICVQVKQARKPYNKNIKRNTQL